MSRERALRKEGLAREKEALEQQTAISEVLRIISDSPADVRPVLDAVAVRAAKICDAFDARIWLVEGSSARLAAGFGDVPMPVPLGETLPLNRGWISGRAILECKTLHIEDSAKLSRDEYPITRRLQERTGLRTTLSVPLMRENRALGAILLRRRQVRRFSDKQIALLKTFADQAALAIENVRLFNETKEALEQQTATAEILKVISGTPTDVQPVFDAIAKSALHIFNGMDVGVGLVEGDAIRIRAGTLSYAGKAGAAGRIALNRDSYAGRAILDGCTFNIADAEEPDTPAVTRERARMGGWRSIALVPMLREGTAIGYISVHRSEPIALDAKQFALLKTFASQAVIAIENVRLFTELQTTNATLREALEQQTATSELLKIIGRSTFDLGPVFETLAKNTVRLCDAERAFIFRFDGELLHVVATHNVPSNFRTWVEQNPIAPGRHSSTARTALERRTIHIRDVMADPEYTYGAKQVDPIRTVLTVPMLRAGELLGVLLTYRHEVRPFTDSQIALLETFADQAAIAIENARLFNETKEALERQTATSDILRVISSSTTDVQPVFDEIVQSGLKLFPRATVVVALPDDERVRIAAVATANDADEAAIRSVFPIALRREYMHAVAIMDRRVIDVPDAATNTDPSLPGVRSFLATGLRAATIVPMLRGDAAIGTISVIRRAPGPLTDKQMALLRTFADQAVIAIENARLFKELQERTEALTKSVGQLTALGEVGQAISSTLDLGTVLKTIVSRAVQLTNLDAGVIYEYDEPTELFHLRAAENISEELLEIYRSRPIKKGDGAVGGTAIAREPVQIPETQDESYKSQFRDLIIRTGRRALLAVPLIHEEHIVGALTVQSNRPGPFRPEIIELLNTFATQSALAIQNAKLFREIQDKSAQLEVANKHKSDFLANMSHELRTPLNAIIGFSEALMDRMFGDLNDKQLEYQKDIHESGKHLLSLINDILDLSKIEAGRMELELSNFHLPTAVSNAVILVRERAMRHGIALGMDIDQRLGDFQADERKVKQILLNLLSNAVKFTPDGGRVDVSAQLDTDKVEIAVKDTGVGITPEDQTSLFEEFKQLGKDSSRKAEGTGLGLALTKRLVELHGGQILVDSAVGKGSTFKVMLPLRR